MKRFAVLTVGIAVSFAPSALSAADASLVPTQPKETTELVRKLSDETFDVREAAIKRLSDLGKAAESALRKGLTDEDPEVRRQCEILLERATRSDLTVALDAFLADHQEKHVLKLPAWNRFSKLAGDDPSAKALFVEMCCSEAVLLEALEKDPKVAGEKFAARAQQLQQSLFTPTGQRGTVTLGQITALLFIATDSRIQLTTQAHYPIYTLLHPPAPREGMQTNTIARKLLVTYLEQRTDPNLVHQNLYLAINFNLKEAVGWALKTAKNKDMQPYARATALAVVGRVGGKEHLKELEPFLTDTTAVGTSQFNTVRINTELRDVALAMIVQLSGQQAADYGFPYLAAIQPALRANPQQIYFAPTLLGFGDTATRDAAFKRWKDWSEADKKAK
jgi:hypothetical protein